MSNEITNSIEAMELSAQELDTVAGGAVKLTELKTRQRTEEVHSDNYIGPKELASSSVVVDDQFEADQFEKIITGI